MTLPQREGTALDTIVRRIGEYHAAGADQVVVQLNGLPAEWVSRLAEAVR